MPCSRKVTHGASQPPIIISSFAQQCRQDGVSRPGLTLTYMATGHGSLVTTRCPVVCVQDETLRAWSCCLFELGVSRPLDAGNRVYSRGLRQSPAPYDFRRWVHTIVSRIRLHTGRGMGRLSIARST